MNLLALVARLNADKQVNGILVQLPLPPQIDSQKVIGSIEPDKDVAEMLDLAVLAGVSQKAVINAALRQFGPEGLRKTGEKLIDQANQIEKKNASNNC